MALDAGANVYQDRGGSRTFSNEFGDTRPECFRRLSQFARAICAGFHGRRMVSHRRSRVFRSRQFSPCHRPRFDSDQNRKRRKIQTEDVESAYAKEPAIREIGILEKSGNLVALIVPNRAASGDNIDAAVRAALETASRRLPTYERISDYAITADTLPQTRLGKIQRHRLPARFDLAKTPVPKPTRAPRCHPWKTENGR